MEPKIGTGSLIFTQYTPPSTLKKDDIITFITPNKDHEIVTHRIQSIEQKNNAITIKTKGDHNKNIDNWNIGGGGVIGKVLFSIPLVGFFFAFTQTKLGLVLFVLIPSVIVLFKEIGVVSNSLRRKKTIPSPELIMSLAALSLLIILPVKHSSALLSDNATLADNQFSVLLLTPTATPTPTITPISIPTPTLTPTPTSESNCDITVSGNGAGSTNVVICTNSSSTTISQTNNTSVTNSTTVTSNTGGNSGGNSGNSTSSVTTTTTTNGNNVSQ